MLIGPASRTVVPNSDLGTAFGRSPNVVKFVNMAHDIKARTCNFTPFRRHKQLRTKTATKRRIRPEAFSLQFLTRMSPNRRPASTLGGRTQLKQLTEVRYPQGFTQALYESTATFPGMRAISTQHNPEFHDAGGLSGIRELSRPYCADAGADCVRGEGSDGTTICHFGGYELDLAKWETLTMREAIIKWWPEDLNENPPTLETLSSEAGMRQWVDGFRSASRKLLIQQGARSAWPCAYGS